MIFRRLKCRIRNMWVDFWLGYHEFALVWSKSMLGHIDDETSAAYANFYWACVHHCTKIRLLTLAKRYGYLMK